jgi:hypothetical protein
MAKNFQEAYEKGYADGQCLAEKMRWQGTPMGALLKGSGYQPDGTYRAAYDEGFKQAMEKAARIEWLLEHSS